MIKDVDVRIGNIIYSKVYKRNIAVTCIDPLTAREKESEFEGIELTPEILEKCGFADCFSIGLFRSLYSKNEFLFSCDTGKNEYGSYGMVARLKYLHQLQNLYFALTGEELKIEL